MKVMSRSAWSEDHVMRDNLFWAETAGQIYNPILMRFGILTLSKGRKRIFEKEPL